MRDDVIADHAIVSLELFAENAWNNHNHSGDELGIDEILRGDARLNQDVCEIPDVVVASEWNKNVTLSGCSG